MIHQLSVALINLDAFASKAWNYNFLITVTFIILINLESPDWSDPARMARGGVATLSHLIQGCGCWDVLYPIGLLGLAFKVLIGTIIVDIKPLEHLTVI